MGKERINSRGKNTGGDMGFPSRRHNITPRNIKRLLKKFPNDIELQQVLNARLKELIKEQE